MEITDWELFFQSCEGDPNPLTDSICGYLSFCGDTVLPTKQVKVFQTCGTHIHPLQMQERVVTGHLTAMVADQLDPLYLQSKAWGGGCLPDPSGQGLQTR